MTDTTKTDEPDSKTRLRLWIKMLRMTRETEASLRENLRTNFETTLPRFDVLATLYQYRDGLKMSELSEHLLVSNGSATVVVDRLEKEGLVERKSVPGDRRAWHVYLTRTGFKTFEEQASVHEEWVDELLADISLKDAKRVINLLDKRQSKRT